jgi:hypothetical protein
MTENDSMSEICAEDLSATFQQEIANSIILAANEKMKEVVELANDNSYEPDGAELDAEATVQLEKVSRAMEEVVINREAIEAEAVDETDWQKKYEQLKHTQAEMSRVIDKLIRMVDHMGQVGKEYGFRFPGLSDIAEC